METGEGRGQYSKLITRSGEGDAAPGGDRCALPPRRSLLLRCSAPLQAGRRPYRSMDPERTNAGIGEASREAEIRFSM